VLPTEQQEHPPEQVSQLSRQEEGPQGEFRLRALERECRGVVT
jgi:hypothetical protein